LRKKLTEKTLYTDLARNYFDASCRSQKSISKGEIGVSIDYSHYLTRVYRKPVLGEIENSPISRNVIIVGAGASNASYSALPNGTDAVNKIKKLLGASIYEEKSYSKRLAQQKQFLKNRVKQANNEKLKSRTTEALDLIEITETHYDFHLEKFKQERHQTEIQFPHESDLDFESTLALLAGFYSIKEIRNKLQNIFDRKFFPSLTYEIIAHLLKHRFIDAVINFNFDELLDQSIDEELGTTEYKKILSDGDCKDFNDLIVDGRLKQPIYIKPHGTASHKSTLRFTKSDYLGIPRDIEDFITRLLIGDTGSNSFQLEKIKRVNLIFLGFGMESVEFNTILSDVSKNRKLEFHAYFYNRSESSKKKFDSVVSNSKNKMPNNVYSKTISAKRQNLEIKIEDLWKRTFKTFNGEFKPRDIARNKLICNLFKTIREADLEEIDLKLMKTKKNGVDRYLWMYSLTRVYVELIISIFLNKGKINIVQLVNGKPGIYYEEYYRCFKEWKNKSIEKRKDDFPLSIYDMVTGLGLVRNDFFDRQYYRINTAYGEKITFDLILEKLNLESIKKALEFESKRLRIKLPARYIALLERLTNIEELKSELSTIFDISPYDIRAKFSERWYHLFDQHYADDIIHTRLAWKMSFQNLISDRDWQHALLASERGRTFRTNRTDLEAEGRSFSIILSENTYGYNKEFLKDKVRFVATSDLDHHLSIFFKNLDSPSYIKLSDLSYPLTKRRNDGFFGFEVLDHNFFPVTDTQFNIDPNVEYYIEVGTLIPREAIYFRLNSEINEVVPILISSQFSPQKAIRNDLIRGKERKERIWDSDLLFLTKKFYQFSKKSSSDPKGPLKIDKSKYQGDNNFLSWVIDGMKND
jgi:hypothetical protein